MKKTTLAIMAFLFTIFSFSQVNVGSGTTLNEEMPIEPYYKFSYSQVIYTAAEINASGSITGLKYTASPETTLANSDGWEVWLGHTTLSSHSIDESNVPIWVDISELTQVFTGTVSVVDQVVEIVFETPFEYNGTDNLMVAVNETSNVNDNYDSNNHDFYCTLTPGVARGIVSYNDNAAIDPSNPPEVFSSNVRESFANVTFEGIAQSCPNPDAAVVDSVDGVEVTLSWANDIQAENFEWALLPAAEEFSGESQTDPQNLQEVFYDGLEPTTEYVFYLRNVCEVENSGWVATYFTTGCTMFELPFYESFEDDSLTWQCWTVEDLTPDGANANNSWTPITSIAVDGTRSAYLWTVNNQGKNDDYLITPQLNLSGNDRLKFSVSSFPNTDNVNSMSVLLSTTTANPEDFTTVLSEATEYPGYWTEVNIDLSAYSGPVYIAFYVPPTPTEGQAIYLDGITFEENPECDYPINLGINSITNNSVSFSWEAVNDDPAVFESFETALVGYADDGQNLPYPEMGDNTTESNIQFENISPGETFDFIVRTVCVNGSVSEWVTLTFTTPPLGDICEDAVIIEGLPFDVTDDTENYNDSYDGSIGDEESCGASQSYLNGNDVFYSYYADYDMSVNVSMTPDDTYSAIIVYDSCESIGVSCYAASTQFSTVDEHNFDVELLAGQTYIFAISTWASPQTVGYDLSIVENTCTQPVITSSTTTCVDDQYYIDVDVSDLGSSTQYAIFDDQGNEQSTDAPSVLTFGPYSGAIPVVISAIGDDPNCDQSITVTSPCQACVPLGINCNLGDGFVGLVIADIDNSESGCSPDGYGVFPELTTDLEQGATYSVTVTTGYTNQYVRAWVDFNDDYEYSLDELIIDNALIATTGTTNIEAVIPADANLGTHSMRFKANWNAGVPDDACEVTSYGEVEDYFVTIVESLSTNDYQLEGLKIYPNPVNGDFVTIKSPIAGDKFINLFDINGRKVLSTTLVGDMLNISSFSAGFYMIEVSVGDSKKVSKLVIE
tara:strand:+ start:535 stop:3561 length:3027 start_codon:yes stop_codon:yes gene_type:complete